MSEKLGLGSTLSEVRIKDIESENKVMRNIIEGNYDKYIDLKFEIDNLYIQYKTIKNKYNNMETQELELKKQIIKLELELEKSSNLISELEEKNKIISERLYALKNSKLGKLNVAYWNFIKKRKEKVK